MLVLQVDALLLTSLSLSITWPEPVLRMQASARAHSGPFTLELGRLTRTPRRGPVGVVGPLTQGLFGLSL